MKKQIGFMAGIGLGLAGLVNAAGCSTQSSQRSWAERDYRSSPIIVWPVGKNVVGIDFFDGNGVESLALYDRDGKLMERYSTKDIEQKSFEITSTLKDGRYKLVGHDRTGEKTEKNFSVKNGTEISPKDGFRM